MTAVTMASPEQNALSLEEIEAKIASLTLLKNQKIVAEAEAEAKKKDKKDKKKGKTSKLDVKVPKVTILTNTKR